MLYDVQEIRNWLLQVTDKTTTQELLDKHAFLNKMYTLIAKIPLTLLFYPMRHWEEY